MCVYSFIILVSCFFLFWVCWVRGNFSGGPGHIYSVCVCLRCVECRAGTILFGTFLERMAGLYRFFSFLWLCCSGYGTVEMVRGVVCLSSRFLQCAVSSLGGWMSVVGFCFSVISFFFGKYVVVIFRFFRVL